jgi:hypothetical protein
MPDEAASASSQLASASSLWPAVLLVWLAAEIAFYFYFQYHLVPLANQRTPPQPYRGYERDRHLLLLKILHRIEWTCEQSDQDVRLFISKFLQQWFHPVQIGEQPAVGNSGNDKQHSAGSQNGKSNISHGPPPPPLQKVSSESMASSEESSVVGSNEDCIPLCSDSKRPQWTVPGLGRQDTDEFFAWAFFGKLPEKLQQSEVDELQICYDQMQERLGLVFPPGSGWQLQPLRLSLEDVNPLHRPLAVYATVWMFQLAAGVLLRAVGYQRIVSASTGLTGWYRAARNEAGSKLLPLLFFHGIAPAGLVFYLPMVLMGLGADGRAVFLFENKSISCSMTFDALTEENTVRGVTELVDRYLEPNAELAVCGHSFGSCQLTWLLHAPIRNRIRQLCLVDPVSILLSSPDVMTNFLYADSISKIRLVAASELFTEYYLRRHFSWYNSELWLEDLPEHLQVIVALSECDEIVNSPNVKLAIEMHTAEHVKDADHLKVVYWKDVGHASCVTSPAKWKDLKTSMLKQELALERQKTS